MWSIVVALAEEPASGPVEPPEPAAEPAPAPPGPPTEAWIGAEVDRVYGKDVPEAAICVARPELPAPFEGFVTPVAVRRGTRGCLLLGVLVHDTWYEPAAALPAAVSPEAWAALDPETRTARWLTWADEVLLAFDQPVAGGLSLVTTDRRGVTTVDRQYLRRDDASGRSALAVSKWTFAADRSMSGVAEQVLARWDTALYIRPDRLQGVPEAAVDAALRSKGRVVRECFEEAWEADLTVEGRVRLEWDVAAGKVGRVAVITEEGTNEDLAACYARGVRTAAYPPEIQGTVRWVFAISRDPVQ